MRGAARALIGWIVVAATILLSVPPAGAVSPGSRDSTFSGDGLVAFTNRYRVALAPMSDTGVTAAIYRDSDFGNGMNATSGPFRTIRYGPGGELVELPYSKLPLYQFSPEGISFPQTATETASGSLLVAGAQLNATIGRLGLTLINTSGDYDTQFSGDGRTVMKVFSASYDEVGVWNTQQLASGKIMMAVYGGNYTDPGFETNEQALVRLNANGSMDTTFSGDGILPVSLAADDATFEPSGVSYVTYKAGTRAVLRRYTAGGALDTSFSGDGITSVACGDFAGAFEKTDPAGRPVVACLRFIGPTTVDTVLYRFTTSGALDPTYGTAGKAIVNMPLASDQGVMFDFDDSARWWMAGRDPSPASVVVNLVRTTADGAYDPTFSGDGRAATTLPWSVDAAGMEVGPTRAFVVMQRSTATTTIMAIAA